jgi:pimeloyl-ACP methyl ester carboxylesterase
MSPMPTLVLVHGAWHGPWAWSRLLEDMPDVETLAVALPSVGRDPAGLGDMHADAEAVRSVVAAVGGPVLVCAHSYGGIPTTEAVGDLPNVVGLVYLCAFQLDVGDSLYSTVGAPASWWDTHPDEGYVDTRQQREILYHDVDGAMALAAIARLEHQSLLAFRQPLTRAAWRNVPSTYVVCEQDRAIPVAGQEAMAQRATRVLRMPTSHSPFLSRPAQLAGVLRAELSTARKPAAGAS